MRGYRDRASKLTTLFALCFVQSCLGVTVHRVRINAQNSDWFGSCPPKRIHEATSGDCINGREILGVPTTDIRLTWEIMADRSLRDVRQLEYEAEIFEVGGTEPVWTSKNISSSDSFTIARPIPELHPEASYFCRVRTLVSLQEVYRAPQSDSPSSLQNSTRQFQNLDSKHAAGVWTNWSTPVYFDTDLGADSWQARGSMWISGYNELRSSFQLASTAVARARLYSVGLGSFVVFMNGERVGDHVFDPPQTAYPKRLLYSTYNITQRLRSGSNVVGVRLGRYKFGYMDVWCNLTAANHQRAACRSFRMQLVVEMEDGSVFTHVSSVKGWEGRWGPIVYDHEYHGEIYDSRRELGGWNNVTGLRKRTGDNISHHLVTHTDYEGTGHNHKAIDLDGIEDGDWGPVVEAPPARISDSALMPTRIPPIRIVESRLPISISKIEHPPHDEGVRCAPTSGRIGGSMTEDQFGKEMFNLSCAPGTGVIEKIVFADFGLPVLLPHCSGAEHGSCGANNTVQVVEKLCLGKSACAIAPRVQTFGHDPCPDQLKRLVILATGCKPSPPPPRPVLPPNETSYVFDFGQNVAGFTSLHVSAALGSKIFIRHGEDLSFVPEPGDPSPVLNKFCSNNDIQPGSAGDNGCTDCHKFVGAGQQAAVSSVWGGNCANQTNLYIASGTGDTEHYYPEFMYAGFRYAQVWGLPKDFVPTPQTLVQHFLHTDVPVAGSVQLPPVSAVPNGTQDVLNRIQHATVYAQRSNLFSIPTDCPQRERRGWMGDAHMSSGEAILNHDMEAFYSNFLDLMRDDQNIGCEVPMGEGGGSCSDAALHRGSLPDVVPFTTGPYGAFPGSTVWQSAYPVILYNHWRHYGDLNKLQQHWPGVVALAEYWARQPCSSSGLNRCGGLGDWVDVAWPLHTTPDDSCSAFYNALTMAYMSEMADAMGRAGEAKVYAAAYDSMSSLYWNSFANQTSQTSLIMQLALSLAAPPLAKSEGPVPAKDRPRVSDTLVRTIRAAANHTSSGIIGATFVFDVLAATGHGDVILDMLMRDDFPSFGYWISQNATTLWENWKGSFPHGTSSDNHIMFGGGVGTAVYRHLTGLSMCRQSVAWGCIDVRPLPEMIHRLRSANASVQTARGTATVGWALSSGRLVVNTTVPIGSLAHVWLPSSGLRSITESGIVLWQVNGGLLRRTDVDSSIREISFEQNPYPAVKVTVASGMYSMQGTYKD